MEFSTIYEVCVESGSPFKLTQEMLDAIEERMKQDDKTMAATQLVKMLGESSFKVTGMSPTALFSMAQCIMCIPFANKNKRVNKVECMTSLRKWSIYTVTMVNMGYHCGLSIIYHSLN